MMIFVEATNSHDNPFELGAGIILYTRAIVPNINAAENSIGPLLRINTSDFIEELLVKYERLTILASDGISKCDGGLASPNLNFCGSARLSQQVCHSH